MNCNFNADMPKVPFSTIWCGECFLFEAAPYIKALYYDYAHEEKSAYGVNLVTGETKECFCDNTEVVALKATLSYDLLTKEG